MNKPITNRVKNAPNSPAKVAGEIVMADNKTTEGTDPVYEDVPAEDARTAPKAKSGGTRHSGSDADYYRKLYNREDLKGLSGKALADAGYIHSSKIDDYNKASGYTAPTEKKLVTPGTPGETKRTEYTPEYTRTQTQTTPWENRWADRIADQQKREGRQDARRELRAIGIEEFKQLRREGAGLRQAFKGARDITTGRGDLSAKEMDLYLTKRNLKDVEEAQAAENAYRRLATRGDKVESTEAFTTAHAGTTEGGTQLQNFKTNLGGEAEIGPGNAADQSRMTGINTRKAKRAKTAADAAAAEDKRTKRLASEATANIESDIVGKMPKGNDGTIDSKGNPTNKAKSLDDITLNVTDTKLESVPEDNADFKPLEKKTRLNRKKPKIDIKVPDALRMRNVKVEKPVGSPSDQASSGFNIEPEKQILGSEAPAKMAFGRNVGMQSKSALKKGYFKNK